MAESVELPTLGFASGRDLIVVMRSNPLMVSVLSAESPEKTVSPFPDALSHCSLFLSNKCNSLKKKI